MFFFSLFGSKQQETQIQPLSCKNKKLILSWMCKIFTWFHSHTNLKKQPCSGRSWSRSWGRPRWRGRQAARSGKGYITSRSSSRWWRPARGLQWLKSPEPCRDSLASKRDDTQHNKYLNIIITHKPLLGIHRGNFPLKWSRLVLQTPSFTSIKSKQIVQLISNTIKANEVFGW